MKKFAMILDSEVIDIAFSSSAPMYPPDAYGRPVIAVEFEDNVEIGMLYEGGVFREPSEPDVSTTETQLDRIEKAVATSQKEVAQNAVDLYTLQLVKEGLL